uniref:Homing endonuclease LAGLIDADG domain-containing protein n=1 Tax=Trebouxia lynnae TaxID=1825957 RepID=A0A6B9VPR1_9CHLO|nr:hypothetical protein [Trebouxia lynnae]QHO63930.1 hypothetical protein [Trebouxia lynnae]
MFFNTRNFFVKNKKYKAGLEVRVSFSIGQNNRSSEMMEKIALFFFQSSKNIRFDKNLLKYETRNRDHILSVINPHSFFVSLLCKKKKVSITVK